ncbi:MAG: hypothetical protein AB1689_21155 [Thermodesulfobacteriota bacterium]
MSDTLAWSSLGLLGAWHGLNPAMGWLFAVALGMQERSGRAVVAALPPIALGHAASIAATVALLALGLAALPQVVLERGVAAMLVGFGLWKLARRRHPRWVGMRVGFRDLTLWSFLMATAHGAGLMLLPVFLVRFGVADGAHAGHHAAPGGAGVSLGSWEAWAAAVGVHTLAMLAVSAVIALVVYYKVGLAVLRSAWLDLDRIWALALIVAGVAAAW